jgi:LytS/YehU family sensor histidine kinase
LVIGYAIAYSGAAGMVNMFLVVFISLTLFWTEFVARYPRFGGPTDLPDMVYRSTLNDSRISSVVVLAWCFIYIGVTTGQRARHAELNNLRLQNSLKDAQLASLSNQLNPHFLFNSLNNIRFMMYEDVRHADAMVTAFSEILRYSLESSKQEKVRLADELGIIRKYIVIVETQLENRLHFQMTIGPGLEHAMVPPMVLQLLVENAIKHGLDNLQAGGSLTVDGQRDGEKLVLRVFNDTPAAGVVSSQGMGIGLRNIVQRLALLYGPAAALDIEHNGQRFTAQLTLPMETMA